MNILRRLVPPVADWVLYRTDSLPAADLTDLRLQSVGPGQSLNDAQRKFLRQDIGALRLWRFLRFHRRGKGWILFAASRDRICHYTFVTPSRAYLRMFPGIQPGGQMIGPCFTLAEFRGRAIYPRVLSHVVSSLGKQAPGPFYVAIDTRNHSSIRGVEKAGFVRCGVWRGRRCFFDLLVISRRVSD